uniref:Carbohydrate kinase FGGY N-terminal domain-containing protein n=1 Tax=Arion vulgaris TaxID=1028688 RepID=A0A0B6ZUS7_9EUPU
MATEINTGDDSLWLGIDLGTTSVKAVLINIEGDVIQSRSCETGAEVKSAVGNAGYEQDPYKILSTIQDVVLSVLSSKDLSCIRGIGITGQMHSVLMWKWSLKNYNCVEQLDKLDGRVDCSNLYTWQDQRCTPEFLETLPRPSSLYQPLSTGHGCATMFWLAQNQSSFFKDGQFTSCGTIMDFLIAILCGLDHPVTSDQLAASLGYFNKNHLSWDSVLYEDNDFPNYLLPKIVPAGTKIGHVTTSLKGWPSGVPVFVAMGDVQTAMFAALKYTSDAGLGEHVDNVSLMTRLQALAEQSKDRSSTLVVRPVFFGERHNTALQGHISGISSANFSNIGVVFRALCEGLVDHLHDMVPAQYLLSSGISRLLVSGSVSMKNSIVKQRLIDLYTVCSNLSVIIDNESANAVGSAVGAAQVIKNYTQENK